MTRPQWLILAALGCGVVLVYCIGGIFVVQMFLGQSDQIAGLTTARTPTPTATATHAPATPTWTPSPTPPPTATWVLQQPPASANPRATAPSTPLPGAAGPLWNAWVKSQTVTRYRITFDMSAKGNLQGMPGVDPKQGLALFSVTGAVNGNDSQIMFKGFVAMFLSGDPNKAIEIMTIGNKVYIHGPLPMLGATENKWYVSTGQSQATVPQPSEFMDLFGAMPDLSGFKKTGGETLDGRKCDIYSGDKTATYNLFAGLDVRGTLDKQTLEALETAESKFWVCDDGYFHQAWMKLDARDKSQPTEKITLELKLHIYDLNANIKLTPPANAAPLPMPSFGLVTPSPTRKK